MNILDDGAKEVLAKALDILINTQKLIRVGEHNWQGLPTKDDVRQYAFALCGEVHELADELGWKDWKLPVNVNHARAIDEHADVLAFLGILVSYTVDLARTNVDELAEAYQAKTQVNLERLAGKVKGYGGYLVQAPKHTNPKNLQPQYYYKVTGRGNDFYGLYTGYSAETGTYWFKELITGAEVGMPEGDWLAGPVEQVTHASS